MFSDTYYLTGYPVSLHFSTINTCDRNVSVAVACTFNMISRKEPSQIITSLLSIGGEGEEESSGSSSFLEVNNILYIWQSFKDD